MIASKAHLDPRFKAFPNLREDDYESILAVPILAREKLEGALNVRTRSTCVHRGRDRAARRNRIPGRPARSSTPSCTRRPGGALHELEALARISEAVSKSLYLEESLEAIVQTTVESTHATGAAIVLEDGRIAWPEGRAGAHAVRLPLRWRGRTIGELVVDRDTRFTDDDRQLLEAIANQAAVALEHGRMALRGVLAQEIHHRVKNNLQTVASLLRLQARAENVDPRKALGDSVNRILAIAAVHEVLTEHREDDVVLDELIDRLRAMLVQGLVVGRRSPPSSSASRSPASVRRRSRSSSASCSGTHSSTAAPTISIALSGRDGEAVLAIADDGDGHAAAATARGSRSCGRSSGTSSEASSPSPTTRACVQGQVPERPAKGRHAHSHRRGRDDHQARPEGDARKGGIRGVCGGA